MIEGCSTHMTLPDAVVVVAIMALLAWLAWLLIGPKGWLNTDSGDAL
jgi:hypothetical protein